MSDLGKYLPLSRPSGHDESAVTSDWSGQLAGVLVGLLAVLDSLGPEADSRPTLREGWRVGDVVRQLAWRLSATRWERIRDRAAAVVVGIRPSRAGLGRFAVADAISSLRALAHEFPARRHRSVADLSEAVVAAFDIGMANGAPVGIDGATSGAAAFAGVMRAPTPIRGVIRGRTLHASDAGWKIGTGPVLAGTAQAIVLFLYGRAGVPGQG